MLVGPCIHGMESDVILEFAVALAKVFEREPFPPNLQTEGALKPDFAIPVAVRLVTAYSLSRCLRQRALTQSPSALYIAAATQFRREEGA
jgi:hypothetical protein